MTTNETWIPSAQVRELASQLTQINWPESPDKHEAQALARYVLQHTERTPGICSGAMCLKGRRLRVSTLHDFLRNGDTPQTLREEYGLSEQELGAGLLAAGLYGDREDLRLSRNDIWALQPGHLVDMTRLFMERGQNQVTLSYLAEELSRAGAAGLELLAELARHEQTLVREGALLGLADLPSRTTLDTVAQLIEEFERAEQRPGINDAERRHAEMSLSLAREVQQTIEAQLSNRDEPGAGQWWALSPQDGVLPGDQSPRNGQWRAYEPALAQEVRGAGGAYLRDIREAELYEREL